MTTSGVAVGASVAVGSNRVSISPISAGGSGVSLGGAGVPVALALGVKEGWGALAGSDVPQEVRTDRNNKVTDRSRVIRAVF